MIAYSIRNDAKLTLRAFSSKKAAKSYGNGQQIFSDLSDLKESRLTEEEMRRVYSAVTGYAIKSTDREYLSEMLFRAIEASKIPCSDTDFDLSIQSTKEETVTEVTIETNSDQAPVAAKADKAPRGRSKEKFDPNSDVSYIAFGIGLNSLRRKALDYLWGKKNQDVPFAEIISAVYGADKKVDEYFGAGSLVVKGLILASKNEDVKYNVIKVGKGKNVAYKLQAK